MLGMEYRLLEFDPCWTLDCMKKMLMWQIQVTDVMIECYKEDMIFLPLYIHNWNREANFVCLISYCSPNVFYISLLSFLLSFSFLLAVAMSCFIYSIFFPWHYLARLLFLFSFFWLSLFFFDIDISRASFHFWYNVSFVFFFSSSSSAYQFCRISIWYFICSSLNFLPLSHYN